MGGLPKSGGRCCIDTILGLGIWFVEDEETQRDLTRGIRELRALACMSPSIIMAENWDSTPVLVLQKVEDRRRKSRTRDNTRVSSSIPSCTSEMDDIDEDYSIHGRCVDVFAPGSGFLRTWNSRENSQTQ